ncbi:YheT family hydrolase [Kovacikia minuta]|uniref:YheT family hydrolase n=1 Tax=Kovacikia minuta TaxID=2931930 RepID=UPI0020C76171
MNVPPYLPPFGFTNGLAMTLYTALWASRHWEKTTEHPEPPYQTHIFQGAEGVPIFGTIAIPERAKGTIVGTYGITGSLENQWFLKLLGRKAFAQGYAVVLFDWRAHGKTIELSPTLTSDGIYEGKDFVQIAAQAKTLGCPAPFWFTAYSLGGQLALWGIKAAQTIADWAPDLELTASEIGGGAVICPTLESTRSLNFLVKTPQGRYLEKSIARQLQKIAWKIYEHHPTAIDPTVIARVNSIWSFDHELVVQQLGFSSVEAYYEASSALYSTARAEKINADPLRC